MERCLLEDALAYGGTAGHRKSRQESATDVKRPSWERTVEGRGGLHPWVEDAMRSTALILGRTWRSKIGPGDAHDVVRWGAHGKKSKQ